jgi:hypothetical protein
VSGLPRRWLLALAAGHPRADPVRRERIDPALRRLIAGDAWDLASAIALADGARRSRMISDDEAWRWIREAGQEAQRRYRSWQEYAEGYAIAFDQITDGRASCRDQIASLLAGEWGALPWDVELWELPVRQGWCLAIGAVVVVRDGAGAPRALGGATLAGRTHLAAAGITTRDELIAWTRLQLRGDAAARARVIAMVGYAACAGVMSEEDAWHVVLVAGKLVQQAHRSWDELAAALGGSIPQAVRAWWAELPWDTPLEVMLLDADEPESRPRVLAVICPACGAAPTRPSSTAFVYCDHCAALVDYDFSRAASAAPGPVYEALRGALAEELTTALDAGDRERYGAAQRRLFEAWIDACPAAVPIRVKDPDYRAHYAAWLAEAAVLAAFDAEARASEAAMRAAVERLEFVEHAGRARVLPEPFAALVDAVFAYEARRDEVFVAAGLYERHPDAASRELARRIGHTAFVQGWLPLLDEPSARALVERTGLARDYVAVPDAPTIEVACTTCGGPLAIVRGAQRVICDHCGRVVGVTT